MEVPIFLDRKLSEKGMTKDQVRRTAEIASLSLRIFFNKGLEFADLCRKLEVREIPPKAKSRPDFIARTTLFAGSNIKVEVLYFNDPDTGEEWKDQINPYVRKRGLLRNIGHELGHNYFIRAQYQVLGFIAARLFPYSSNEALARFAETIVKYNGDEDNVAREMCIIMGGDNLEKMRNWSGGDRGNIFSSDFNKYKGDYDILDSDVAIIYFLYKRYGMTKMLKVLSAIPERRSITDKAKLWGMKTATKFKKEEKLPEKYWKLRFEKKYQGKLGRVLQSECGLEVRDYWDVWSAANEFYRQVDIYGAVTEYFSKEPYEDEDIAKMKALHERYGLKTMWKQQSAYQH